MTCFVCQREISFPDQVDGNGTHYPVYDRRVLWDGRRAWHEDCWVDWYRDWEVTA